MNRMALTLLFAVVVSFACAGCAGMDGVRVYEGTREILTGPGGGGAPQTRPDDFTLVRHPAVYVENEYLRCCLLPQVGGRLYEVYNKVSKSQVFYVNPYLELNPDSAGGAWNLGGVEVNFPYFHHGNTYNDRWQWDEVRRDDGCAGVSMGFTSRPTMQRAVFCVLLRPGSARVEFDYRFENLNPYPWGLAAWIDTMHPKTMETEFIMPSAWMAGHGHNCFRTNLDPWPIRNGIDLSWEKNLPEKSDLSEFAFMPRQRFHGCYDHAEDRGPVRIFDPQTLPAAKLWTQAPPLKPEQYYQHFEIWTATSPVMEDAGRQGELSCHSAADSWYQVWGIGGYVFANEDLALNLVCQDDGRVLAGICGSRPVPGCVVSLREGHDTFFRTSVDLDPERPWKATLDAPAGDVVIEVTGPDGRTLASYEHREDEVPREYWKMPEKPRWQGGINNTYHDEDYSTLWRSMGDFFDGAIGRYRGLLREQPDSVKLMVDVARVCLKNNQVRLGSWYRNPGPNADADAARRRQRDIETAVDLLQQAIEKDPAHSRARFYLGLALERQGKNTQAANAYRAALTGPAPAPAAAMYLARLVVNDDPSQAAALARQAAELYPQSTRAGQMLMVALIANGEHVDAASAGLRLRELDPSNLVTLQLLADALRPSSHYVEKIRRLEKNSPDAMARARAEIEWMKGANEE